MCAVSSASLDRGNDDARLSSRYCLLAWLFQYSKIMWTWSANLHKGCFRHRVALWPPGWPGSICTSTHHPWWFSLVSRKLDKEFRRKPCDKALLMHSQTHTRTDHITYLAFSANEWSRQVAIWRKCQPLFLLCWPHRSGVRLSVCPVFLTPMRLRKRRMLSQ